MLLLLAIACATPLRPTMPDEDTATPEDTAALPSEVEDTASGGTADTGTEVEDTGALPSEEEDTGTEVEDTASGGTADTGTADTGCTPTLTYIARAPSSPHWGDLLALGPYGICFTDVVPHGSPDGRVVVVGALLGGVYYNQDEVAAMGTIPRLDYPDTVYYQSALDDVGALDEAFGWVSAEGTWDITMTIQ